ATVDVLANGITREQGVASLALLPTKRARERSERALGSIAVRVPLDADERHVLDSRTSVLVGGTAYDDPLLELALYTKSLHRVGRRLEQSLGASLDVTDELTLRPIVSLAHEWIERDPNDIPLGHAHREFARTALGAEERLAPWLTLRALARGECHHTGAKD